MSEQSMPAPRAARPKTLARRLPRHTGAVLFWILVLALVAARAALRIGG